MTDASHSGSWQEYKRLVMRDLERFETQIQTMLRETDGLRGNFIAMSEQVAQLRKHLDQYAQAFESQTGALEKRVSTNEQSLARMQGRAAGLGTAAGGGVAIAIEAARAFLGL